MTGKFLIRLGIILAAIILIAGGYYWLNQEKPEPGFTGVRETVRIGVSQEPLESLFMIAAKQGFFSDEGLDVIIKEYPSGKRAMEGMFNQEVDASTTAETPIVFKSFERHDFRIVASISSTENYIKIVARKDRRIQKPADLRGRRIATQEASALHFFTHLFLIRNALSEKDVNISFFNVEELPEALARGDADAISAREPLTSEAKKLSGDNAIVFAEPGLYRRMDFLVISNVFMNDKPEVIKKIMLALIRAEEFAEAHPEQSVKIVSKKLGLNESALSETWHELDFKITLDQSLFIGLEDQARWAIMNNLTNKTKVPNYLDFTYAGSLEAVKPGAVTIIH